MKTVFLTTLVCFKLCASLPLLEDYHKAREIARMYERPMVMILTSKGDERLNEVIHSKAFADFMENECIFVKLESSESPVVVLLDKDEQEIARVGYQGQSSEEFGGFLKERLSSYQRLLLDFENAKSEKELEPLYEKAVELGSFFYREKILEKGLSFQEGTFFPLEQYVAFVNQGKKECPEAKAMRARVEMKRDDLATLRLALIDFQESGQVGFLDAYIKEFGEKDARLTSVVANL